MPCPPCPGASGPLRSKSAPVAQGIERPPSKRRVRGSRPLGGAGTTCSGPRSGLLSKRLPGLTTVLTTITETRADVVVPAEQCGRSLIGFATALLLKGGRSGTEERLLDPFRGHGLAVRKNVAVARCLRHLGVAENGAGRPQVELVFEHHRRRRVPQVVEPSCGDVGLNAKQLEGSGIGPRVKRAAGRVCEDPTPSRPGFPHLGGQALGNLRAPVRLELGEDARRQRQDTASRVGLGLPQVQTPAPALRTVRATLAGT